MSLCSNRLGGLSGNLKLRSKAVLTDKAYSGQKYFLPKNKINHSFKTNEKISRDGVSTLHDVVQSTQCCRMLLWYLDKIVVPLRPEKTDRSYLSMLK